MQQRKADDYGPPRGIHPGIIDFAVFGIKHKEDILIP